MLHSKSNEFILVCQHVPLPGCRLALFEVSFGNITNIRVPGTRSKNSSGYPGAKLPEICTPRNQPLFHVMLPDITGRLSFSCAARCCKRQISCHNKRYIQSRPCTGEVQHVTNIETCTLLCCDYSTLWEALHVNMVEIGARCSDKNVKILGRYQWIG